MIPCQMTMDAFGLTMNDLIDGVEQPVGAATALEYASEAGINWFI
jgi:peroxiredoxin family protein